jgi:hypothetical protein
MSLHSLRKQSWLRTAFAALVLCFTLGSIAHAGHSHEQSNARAHVVCDYCVSFGSLIDALPQVVAVGVAQATAQLVTVPDTAFIPTRPVSVAQARAPPASC